MNMKVLSRLKHAGVYLRTLGIQKSPCRPARPYPWEAAYPAGVSWHFEVKHRPLYALLDDAVAAYPTRICLRSQGKKYRYIDLGKLVTNVAKGLRRLGVRQGIRVGLFLPNSAYFVICYYAILKAGGTVVNFNPLYAEREISRQIDDSETSIMITLDLKSLYPKIAQQLDHTCLKRIIVCRMNGALSFPQNHLFGWFWRKEVAEIPTTERHVMFDALIRNAPDFEPANIDPERDVAVLQYTGGITGNPKGAMLTHANLYTNAVQVKTFAIWVKPGNETCFVLVPLCHAFGMTVMNFGFAIGAELVLLPQLKVRDVFNTIQRQRCTLVFGVPTIYSALAAHRDVQRYDLSSLRMCISGGAPLAPEVKSAFESRAGCAVIEGYGLTEASPVCTLIPPVSWHKPGFVGLPLPGTVIEIASLAHPNRILPRGELGEICVRGPQVMAGYWKRPEETEAVIKNGLLRTGDFGYIDEDGYLFIVDRVKEMIISGGFNVYPRIVEETLRLHPAVAHAFVCGLPDRHRGERVKAYVKLREGSELTAAQLRAFLKDKLAPFEIPSEIEFLQEIPADLLHRPARKDLLSQKFGIEALMPRIARRLHTLLQSGQRHWLRVGRPPRLTTKLKPLVPKIHDRARA
jgi:long-chain acyl-CoA synthetase